MYQTWKKLYTSEQKEHWTLQTSNGSGFQISIFLLLLLLLGIMSWQGRGVSGKVSCNCQIYVDILYNTRRADSEVSHTWHHMRTLFPFWNMQRKFSRGEASQMQMETASGWLGLMSCQSVAERPNAWYIWAGPMSFPLFVWYPEGTSAVNLSPVFFNLYAAVP